MVLGDLMASRFSQSYVAVSNHLDECSNAEEVSTATSIAYLDRTIVLCDLRHEAFEGCVPSGPSDSGLVSKWRLKDRMKTGCVAIVLCLNISVDTPDVIKISPCARMECWIDPTTMATQKALETIGKTLTLQYERWQPRACYKIQLDPTVEEVRKLCSTCRKYAKSERVLFHYNGHGVPMPTANGEIWLFNKLQDCSTSCGSSMRDCILLAACETLPQNTEFPADVFTSCLTTPIKMALRWFCTRSLLRESLDYSLID